MRLRERKHALNIQEYSYILTAESKTNPKTRNKNANIITTKNAN